jgi:hypothetical protein
MLHVTGISGAMRNRKSDKDRQNNVLKGTTRKTMVLKHYTEKN